MTPEEVAAAPQAGWEPAYIRAVVAHALGGHSPSCVHLRSPAFPSSCGCCPGDITCLPASVSILQSVFCVAATGKPLKANQNMLFSASDLPNGLPWAGPRAVSVCRTRPLLSGALPTPLAPFCGLLGHIPRWPAHTLLNVPHLSK